MKDLTARLRHPDTPYAKAHDLEKLTDEAADALEAANVRIAKLESDLASQERMFGDACASLALIEKALGIDADEAGGAAPILDAIAERKTKIAAADGTGPAASADPDHKFAIIRDRNYDGEGLSLWVSNGENYSGADGDCPSRDKDGTLDGFIAEWLTDHEPEQRLKLADAPRAMDAEGGAGHA